MLAPAWVLGEMWVPSAWGVAGHWGKVGVAAAGLSLPDNGVYSLLSGRCGVSSPVWAMWRVLTGSRKRLHPGGAEPGCWGGLAGLGVRAICAPSLERRPPQQCRWLVACLQLGPLENFPSGPGAVFQCNIQCCPNPINSPLCFPHLKSLISWDRPLWCSCMALSAETVPVMMASLQGCGLVWEHLMGFGFLSHFQISEV